ncbi:MAG: polysaccharide pyruvyl transferase family protein [Candidatus Dormibacteria bacterium]
MGSEDPAGRQLILGLRARIDEALRPLLTRGSRVALLGFPHYGNVGDSAIWEGARRCLDRLGCRIVHTAGRRTYSSRRLRSLSETVDVILLSGGGNLGDLWMAEQAFRERVILDFPDRRIVQLPQSIWFTSPRLLAQARTVLGRHGDLTLLCRDHGSLEQARAQLTASAVLCPDLALELELARREPVTAPILWLSRGDRESLHRPDGASGTIPVIDWAQPATFRDRALAAAVTVPLIDNRMRLRHRFDRWRSSGEALVARRRVEMGRRTLAAAQVVITDRLHGHVFCLLMGIPHVILDTRQGKLAGFHSTWTSGSGITSVARSAADAGELARLLL